MKDAVPEASAASAWQEYMAVMNPKGALDDKTKQLIALGVAAQIPCQYCIYADKGFAKLDGATDEELSEAISMAALTRHWSTFLNGVDLNQTTFRKEVDADMLHAKGATASAK